MTIVDPRQSQRHPRIFFSRHSSAPGRRDALIDRDDRELLIVVRDGNPNVIELHPVWRAPARPFDDDDTPFDRSLRVGVRAGAGMALPSLEENQNDHRRNYRLL
jgi:hypothetical protein